jgi:hypothetical protein
VRIACVLLVFFASLASAQTKPPAKIPPAGTNGAGAGDVRSAPTTPESVDPKLSDAAHAKIRDLQLQQKDVQVQYLQMQQQLAGLEKQFNGLTAQLNDAVDAAYKEMGVKREDWPLDMATLKLTKAEKKPEAKK